MRKLFCSVVMVFTFIYAATAQQILTCKATVDKATVYLTGATLTSTADFNLKQGINELVFENISSGLNTQSLQASGKGNFVIMDVRCNVKMNEQPTVKPDTKFDKIINQLNDSITEMEFVIEELTERNTALQSEKNILLNNRLMKGETKQDTLALFTEAISFLRSRLENINAETFKVKRALQKNNVALANLQQRYQELIDAKSKTAIPKISNASVCQAIVTVMAETESAARVSVSYYVNGAGWKPTYDIRASGTSNTIGITHKAQLYQNTGLDWNNTAITLATATPNQGINKPQLNPQLIGYFMAVMREKRKALNKQELDEVAVGTTTMDAKKPEMKDDAEDMALYTDMVENLVQTEYNIKLKYNIPTDGKEHMVVIQNTEVKADYNFSAIPKLDAKAYLQARITDWSDLNLLPGISRIFFDNSFVGQSVIDPYITNDTMLLSLGKDKSIIMQRKKLKDKTRQKFLGEDKTISYSFEISLKNTKSLPVNITVEDQIPISNTQEIEVKLIAGNKANYNIETGKLEWDLQLKPGESKKLLVTYEVKLPKNKTVAGM